MDITLVISERNTLSIIFLSDYSILDKNKGYNLQGMQVMWTADLIHKNEQYYNEPEAFNPHRFDGQESNTLQEKVCAIPKNLSF